MNERYYTEDQLVEQPAIGLFAELGWTIAFGNPHPGPLPCCAPSPPPLPEGEELGKGVWVDETGMFGRETKGEVVLVARLRAALERLNPALPSEAIAAAVDELTRDRLSARLLDPCLTHA
jgi:type I restriction enzyme R subunit